MAKREQTSEDIVRKKRPNRRGRTFLIYLIGILVALGLAAFVAFSFGYSIPVCDSSMSSTLDSGDRVLVNRIAYAVGKPSRGDIVAYRKSDSQETEIRIKRVIGIPGDTVRIEDGQVRINGQVYLDDRSYPSILNPGLASKDIVLESNEYFLLGDNRNDSEDSRFADVGNIMKNEIIGKVWFIIDPSEDFGFIS